MFTIVYVAFVIRLSCYMQNVYGSDEILFTGNGGSRKIVHVMGNSTTAIVVQNISPTITAVLFEVHSHVHNVILSELETEHLHHSVSGRNIGMVYRLHIWESEARMWLINKVEKKLPVLIIISSFDSYDPIPGACNMEFSTEIAPYLQLKSDSGKVYLEYQHANLGVLRDQPAPFCSISSSYITYDVYVTYLKENDFGKEEYFNKIDSMSNATSIKESSNKVQSYSVHPDTRISFLMYPNIGVVYNVIAKYTVNGIVKESLYVPISSYGCGSSEFFSQHGCNFSYSFEGKAFLFLLSLYGFITAYFGNFFYGSTLEKTYERIFSPCSNITSEKAMFFFGFLATFFVTLILLGRFSNFSLQKILKLCGIFGILGGGVWCLLWILLKSSAISLLLVGLVFGFLLSATVMYSPVGNYEINLNDKNYWLLLATGSLFVTVILLSYPTVLSILGSSVVGCYVMLLFYDNFIETRLAYIILNIVKRATSEDLEFATNDFPFQIKDVLICTAWVLLSIFAVVIQSKSLNTSNGIKLCSCKLRRSNRSLSYSPESNPHQPLRSNDSVFYNTFPK